ncbi:hypothetical protein GOBAR_DD36223 [Gossypium barbadense]|nr:hypothetical protein GOBAR_DD36223 [Gossypium barbadense]
MQTLHLKEYGGIGNHPMGQLASVPPSSLPTLPWCSVLGSHQSLHGGEAFGAQLKPFLMEHPSNGDQVLSSKQLNKGNTAQFTIFPGDCKNSGDEHNKPQAVTSLQSDPAENGARFELGFGQHMASAKYPYMDQLYGVFSTYGAQISGRVMLPLNMASEEGPIYVNAKQYKGIMRRRQSRAKAVLQNKLSKARKVPIYALLSPPTRNAPTKGMRWPVPEYPKLRLRQRRHWNKKATQGLISNRSCSSDSGTLNSSKGPTHSGSSEVTSIYSRRDLDHHFLIDHLGLSVHSISSMINNQRGGTITVATADNCCNLKV